MKIYYFILLDHKGEEVMFSEQKFGSAKHAAFAADKAVESIPPCAGRRISYYHMSTHEVARMVSMSSN